jgi:hypothetical protein
VLFATLSAYGLGLALAAASVGLAGYQYFRRRKARMQLGIVSGATYWEHVVVGTLMTYLSVAVAVWAHALWVVPILWLVVLFISAVARQPSREAAPPG